MLSKIKIKIKNKNEIFALICLLVLTISLTSYYNFTKKKIKDNYKEIINNIYFKKTTNHFFNQLEPKFKKIRHQITDGETFDNILNQYNINKGEIKNLKKKDASIKHRVFFDKRKKIKLKVHVYYKLLLGMIRSKVSWNEVQNHCLYERKPNKYDPDTVMWLNLYKF